MTEPFRISRVSRVLRKYDGAFTDSDGNAVTDADVEIAILPAGEKPSADTVFGATGRTWAGGVLEVLYAGDQADPAGAVVVPHPIGGDLWALITDTPEVDAQLVEEIRYL